MKAKNWTTAIAFNAPPGLPDSLLSKSLHVRDRCCCLQHT